MCLHGATPWRVKISRYTLLGDMKPALASKKRVSRIRLLASSTEEVGSGSRQRKNSCEHSEW